MEAIVRQKIGRVAKTGRKMFDVNIVITSEALGCLSLHTSWRDMPYPMYSNKIRKLQKLVDLMIEQDWELGTISQFFQMVYENNFGINEVIELLLTDAFDEENYDRIHNLKSLWDKSNPKTLQHETV